MKRWLSDIFYSFPIQLVLLHCRNNLLLIGCWILLTLFMTGSVGQLFGIKYLFLAPEYMGEVDFWSFFFVGLAFGSFFMTWNLTSYLLNAHHFPFLASLARPFTKFILNNIIIPILFLITYLVFTIRFQSYNEFWDTSTILSNCIGFVLGLAALVILSGIYFYFTNKDILSFLKIQGKDTPEMLKNIAPGRRNVDIDLIRSEKRRWRVDTYLTEALRPRIVRSVAHYETKDLIRVFRQNHVNALIVQLFSLVVLIALGYLIDNPYFRIPAGASLLILASVFIAITGAVTYWFDQWRITAMVIILIGINYLTSFNLFNHKNKAYGLNYTGKLSTYSYAVLDSLRQIAIVEEDKRQTIQILETWKSKVQGSQAEKPKMVVLCVSGGGLKAAVWAMQVIQRADSLLNGQFLENTMLVTGASGGMIGAAYLRELQLQKKDGAQVSLYNPQHIDRVAKDLLNSISFTIVSNDIFLPWTEFETAGQTYRKDRGYIFEKQLNENMNDAFAKPIGAYQVPEQQARIPMLFITPAIVNDGRRMVISPQGVSYMMAPPIGVKRPDIIEVDAVDFGRLFHEQGAEKMRFSTALRMNATYPYILPNVFLPSNPSIEVMDAGFRDNFGIVSATRFIHVFKDWIQENTSGVVLVQISSLEKIEEIMVNDDDGVLESILNPLGIAGQLLNLQDYEHDNSLGLIYDILGEEKFEIIRFIYHPSEDNERASVTFHLTQREKKDILKALYLSDNQASLNRLVNIMNLKGDIEIKQ